MPIFTHFHRFRIEQATTHRPGWTRSWLVYDASFVPSQYREAPCIANFETLQQAIDYCDRVNAGQYEPVPHEAWDDCKVAANAAEGTTP